MDEENKISENNENLTQSNQEDPEKSQLDYESDSSTNSDGTEKCPICLLSFEDQEIGRPAVCSHSFCFLCIFEWSKVVKTCPIDRRAFNEISVFENLDSTTPLRNVAINEQVSLNEFTNGESEYTPCEICGSTEREEVMLLCDGCDKGFHMDCLNPPLLEIPEGNWYCVDCDGQSNESSSESEESVDEEADIDEVEDLQNEIQLEMGQLPATRLRTRQQPQIIRTLQSERIRNAILARRTVRGIAQVDHNLIPSTSMSQVTTKATSKKPVKRRKTTKRRRRVTRVVEYEIKDGQKFPVKTTRVVKRRRKRKIRKTKKSRRSSGRESCGSSRPSTSASFRNSNANVYDLQKGRQLAGLSNFNIFEPTYQLDYVPDEEFIDEFEPNSNAGATLTQSIVNYTNPLRRKALIQKRVINNFTTTSSNVNVIDSILNEQSAYVTATPFNKLSNAAAKDKMKKSTNESNESSNAEPVNIDTQHKQKEECSNYQTSDNLKAESSSNPTYSHNENDGNFSGETHANAVLSCEKKSPQKKKKSTTFDMFGDSPVDQEVEQEEAQNLDVCPIFSIYGSVNRTSNENLNQGQDDAIINEEDVDLVQMSDGEHNISEEAEPAVIRSQPASPDLENDVNESVITEERSYTPPIIIPKQKSPNESSDRRKKEREHKKNKRRELERYNVRERFKEKSPRRARDRFGRNRTRTRSRSNERHARRKSRSHSKDRDRHRSRHNKSKTPEKRRKRSYSRSLSSNDRSRHSSKHHKSKHKKSYRRTKSRSTTPLRHHRDKSPRRRDRSTSEKSKKKKRRNRSKETSTAHTKEVYTSGQNILVSVNFNNSNQDDKRSTRSKSDEDKDETIDITAKKKINVNSKPVAIIDLARSPFKELTPEYKKESNVIELSDSENEKHHNAQKAPKSPDSTKLYDPFDILNSPSNENVSSSQTILPPPLKILNKSSVDFTNKLGPAIIKNLNIPFITNNEENLVSSSSSINNIFEKAFPPTSTSNNNTNNANKIEILQAEIIQVQTNPNVSNATIESPYSPGNDFDDAHDDHGMETVDESKTSEKQTANIFDELFGSSTPPFLEKAKSNKKSADPDKYLTKLKRQERVIEEVKMVIKPYYSRRIIDKDQYKEIMRKAVPKICHNKSGEINPTKIKHLIDSYVKFYTHKKRKEPEEVF